MASAPPKLGKQQHSRATALLLLLGVLVAAAAVMVGQLPLWLLSVKGTQGVDLPAFDVLITPAIGHTRNDKHPFLGGERWGCGLVAAGSCASRFPSARCLNSNMHALNKRRRIVCCVLPPPLTV